VDVPAESPKLALFPRNGGFLFPERWFRQNGNLALFRRIMQTLLKSSLFMDFIVATLSLVWSYTSEYRVWPVQAASE